MNYRLKLALTCILTASAFAPAYGENLLEVYQRAQQADPALREAEATRLAANEAKPQALAALLPQIDGSASMTRSTQNTEGSEPRIITDPVTGVSGLTTGTTDTVNEQTRWSVNLRQSVFRWENWATLNRADSQVAQAEATYRAAEQDLAVRVATRYFNVLAAKDTLDANAAAAEAFDRQLEQFEKRFEVGLIAITDVQEARAERDRTAADVITAKRLLATAIESLREITGDQINALAEPKDDMPLQSPNPASEDKWVSMALEQNLNLIAARLAADVANANVSVARGGHLPSLDLVGSYNGSSTDTDTDYALSTGRTRRGTNSDITGDSISLQLTVPIFASGGTQSRVRQQVYTYRAARERSERVTRETERAARDNYLGVMSNISRVQAFKQAMDSSRTALQATEAGFEVGTRTTVDVLLSRRAQYTSQAQYARSRYDYILSVIQLKQAAGILGPQDMAEVNGWLK